MIKDQAVLLRICAIPSYRGARDTEIQAADALRTMLAASQATNPRDAVVQQLAAKLREQPNLQRAWVAFSEDQRSTPNPFIEQEGGRWLVGDLSTEAERSNLKHFDDLPLACAEFILRKVGGL